MNFTRVSFEELDLENNPFIVTGFLAFCFILFFTGMTSISETPQDDAISYDSKYYDSFLELEEDSMSELDIKQLGGSYIKDITYDDETIIMNYSSDYEAFHYWGDSTISFNTLNSMAQLYAIEYNCKSICIDYADEITKANDKMEERKIIQENIICKPRPTNSPFASFKKYNTTASRAAKNSTCIIPEKCNHFRRKGTLAEWDLSNGKWVSSIHSETSKTWVIVPEESIPSQSISYSDWKSVQ